MKFSVKKKLNLSRIDKEMWPYEDEVFEAMDADSLEEAQKMVDMYYAEREGYHRALSEARKAEANKQPSLPLPTSTQQPAGPVPASASLPPANPVVANPPVAPVETPVNTTPAVPVPAVPVENAGASNLPPKEFN